MNSTILKEMVCAPIRFVFVVVICSPWAYEGLDGWHIARQCLLSYLTVPLTFHKQTKTPHWLTPLGLHH